MTSPARSFPHTFKSVVIPHSLSMLYLLVVMVYAFWWLDFTHVGSWVLYLALFLAEVYHVWQVLGYLYTVWEVKEVKFIPVKKNHPAVDVFITVCGEPRSIVEQTVAAAKRIDYPNFQVHILNDGRAAKKPNWQEIDALGAAMGVNVITRTVPGGAKAGNINHGLSVTQAPYFVLFDADHIPHPDFIKRTIGNMVVDPKLAFVQTPQYYANRKDNFITQAAWEQQELFFGPICQGKNRMNATFWCGTNALIRREALLEIGGVPEKSIAEDFLASLLMHEKGWRSLYVPEILAHGLAPADLDAYASQQYRWSRGSLDVMFRYNPLFRRGLTFGQKMQYLYSAGYYLNGLVVLIDALVPLFFLYFGIVPVVDSTGTFVIYFVPFIFLTLYFLMRSTDHEVTFRAIQLTIATSFVFLRASLAAIIGRQAKFTVTSKVARKQNFLWHATPHIVYLLISLGGMWVAVAREGITPAVMTNTSWVLFNIVFFWPYIGMAYPWKSIGPRIGSCLLRWVRSEVPKTFSEEKVLTRNVPKL